MAITAGASLVGRIHASKVRAEAPPTAPPNANASVKGTRANASMPLKYIDASTVSTWKASARRARSPSPWFGASKANRAFDSVTLSALGERSVSAPSARRSASEATKAKTRSFHPSVSCVVSNAGGAWTKTEASAAMFHSRTPSIDPSYGRHSSFVHVPATRPNESLPPAASSPMEKTGEDGYTDVSVTPDSTPSTKNDTRCAATSTATATCVQASRGTATFDVGVVSHVAPAPIQNPSAPIAWEPQQLASDPPHVRTTRHPSAPSAASACERSSLDGFTHASNVIFPRVVRAAPNLGSYATVIDGTVTAAMGELNVPPSYPSATLSPDPSIMFQVAPSSLLSSHHSVGERMPPYPSMNVTSHVATVTGSEPK